MVMILQSRFSGAVKETGLSKNFWIRALGWYSMALIDTVAVMPDQFQEQKDKLCSIYKELMTLCLNSRTQVVCGIRQQTRVGKEGNYLETSGSAIFAYSIMKSVRMGILDKSYFKHGLKAFNGTCDKYLSEKDGELQLDGICLVSGLGPYDNKRRDGTFEYYMSEPIVF